MTTNLTDLNKVIQNNSKEVDTIYNEYCRISIALRVIGMNDLSERIFEYSRTMITSKNILNKSFSEYLKDNFK